MAGIKYTNQINMTVPPTEDNHLIRRQDLGAGEFLNSEDYDKLNIDPVTKHAFINGFGGSINDLNTPAPTNGGGVTVTIINGNSANAPLTMGGVLIEQTNSTGLYRFQMACFQGSATTNARVFTRNNSNGVWGDWVETATQEWAIGKVATIMNPSDESVLDYADTFPTGLHLFVNSSVTGLDTPLPASGFRYILYKHSSTLGTLLAFTTPSNGTVNRAFFNSRNSAGWIGWQEFATRDWTAANFQAFQYVGSSEIATYDSLADFIMAKSPGKYFSNAWNGSWTDNPTTFSTFTNGWIEIVGAENNWQDVEVSTNVGTGIRRAWRRFNKASGGNWGPESWTESATQNWAMNKAAIRLPQGTDFNNVRAGNWYVNNATDAATMLNLPVSNMAGILSVIAVDADTGAARRQIYSTFSGSAVYIRGYSGSPLAWSAWVKVYSSTIETTTVSFKGANLTLRKSNGVVIMPNAERNGISFTANEIAFTLPVGWRPYSTTGIVAVSLGGGNNFTLSVNTNGQVVCATAQPQNHIATGSASWHAVE